ncbi:hypothetical protein OG21DRAFT_764934 [Imleria badia]|nr:hypothetical protein OG21DRAFT_764934 [Imleria badia]
MNHAAWAACFAPPTTAFAAAQCWLACLHNIADDVYLFGHGYLRRSIMRHGIRHFDQGQLLSKGYSTPRNEWDRSCKLSLTVWCSTALVRCLILALALIGSKSSTTATFLFFAMRCDSESGRKNGSTSLLVARKES